MSSFALAEQLHRRLVDAFPPERPYARRDLEASALPRLVAHYLSFRLDQYAHEATALRAADWIDPAQAEVREAAERFEAVLARHARFPAEAWFGVLREAADTTAGYLARPVRAAVRFAFGHDDGALPSPVIVRRLGAFAAYPYLREAVRTYAEHKGVETIDRTRLTALLTRIDHEMTADYDADDWLRLLAPLYDLSRYAYGDDRGVPAGLLAARLDHKDVPPLRRRAQVSERERIDEAHLRRLLTLHLAPPAAPAASTAVPADAAADPSAPSSPPGNDLSADKPRADTPRADTPRADTPAAAPADASADASFADAPPADASSVDPPEAEAPEAEIPLADAAESARAESPGAAPAPHVPEGGVPEGGREDVPLWRRFHAEKGGAASRPAPTPSARRPRWKQFSGDEEDESAGADDGSASPLGHVEADVLGARGAAERGRFVRELFGGDAGAYERVLRRLQHVGTWNQASRIIARDVFRTYQVNIYNETAVAFTNAAEARFRRSAQPQE